MVVNKKFAAYDKAIAELKKAGLGTAFVGALKEDSELMAKVKKVVDLKPPTGPGPKAGWSCCVTA